MGWVWVGGVPIPNGVWGKAPILQIDTNKPGLNNE
jgi:hypothetical protein